MELLILNPELEPIGLIDEAESILWIPKYNDIGEAEIYLPCSEEHLSLLRKGNYIYRYDDSMTCIIETVEITTDIENGDYLTATLKDICVILSDRIVSTYSTFTGSVADFLATIIESNAIDSENDSRIIPNLSVDRSNFSDLPDIIEQSAFTEDLLQLIITTCKSYNYGFRVSLDLESRRFSFALYKGKNKATEDGDEYIEFSPAFANIVSSSYKESDANYKNVAYVGYKDLNEVTQLLMVFRGKTEPQGIERREIYVDATGQSRSISLADLMQRYPTAEKTSYTIEDEVRTDYYIDVDGDLILVATSEGEGEEEKVTVSDYAYLQIIRSLGLQKLDERRRTIEYNGVVDTLNTYEYKVDYHLGDIVKVINDYGIESEAQITEVFESVDNEDGWVIEPKFEYL